MEKDRKISQLLGMKQEDMAMLMRVTRTQWSMYEIGERDLPLASQIQLATMLVFIQQPETGSAEIFPHIESQQAKMRKVLKDQNLVNIHRQMMVERKIQAIKKKYETAMIGLKFIYFLETQEEQLYQEHHLLLNVLKHRAEVAIYKNGLHVQAKQQLKLETLQQEALIINKGIQELQ